MGVRLTVKHRRSQKILAKNVEVADSFKSRLMGLMFLKNFGDRDGIYFKPSNSIHSFFVRFSFDVVFLTKEHRVIKLYKSFKPWRVSPIFFKASRVLELPEGSIFEEVKEGDFLEITYV